MIRMLIAPIMLRFQETDSLLAALDLLDRCRPDDERLKKHAQRARKLIARELLRRPNIGFDMWSIND